MSRPLGRLLILLALWVQFLAPIAAVQAVLAADDPLAVATICGHVAGSPGDTGAPDHHGAAPLCGLCCAAVAVLDAAPPRAHAVALAWTVLVFLDPPAGPVATSGPDLARARDPPALA